MPIAVFGFNEQLKTGPDKIFGGRSTFLLPVQGKRSAYIAMFDAWRPKALSESSHVWLPVQFESGHMKIRWLETWDLRGFGL